MTSTGRDNDAGLAGFLARLDWANSTEALTAGYAEIGLTNFGERPLAVTRLAEVLGWPVSDADAIARQGAFGTRVENGIITVSPERAKAAPRRQLQIGDRRLGVTGCAPDILLHAPLLRPSVQVKETCPATGTPIRLVFTPAGSSTSSPPAPCCRCPARSRPCTPAPRRPATASRSTPTPATPASARRPPCSPRPGRPGGWLDTHPGGRVFPIREAWDLSPYRNYRDRMSALLDRKD